MVHSLWTKQSTVNHRLGAVQTQLKLVMAKTSIRNDTLEFASDIRGHKMSKCVTLSRKLRGIMNVKK